LFFSFLGHLSLKEKNIEKAVKFYIDGFDALSKFSTYPPFDLGSQLSFLETEVLRNLDDKKKDEFLEKMTHAWGDRDISILGIFEGLRF